MPLFDIKEPNELLNFRTLYPHATWKQLKDDSDTNNAVKNSVTLKTGGLCLYCEQKILKKVDSQIEHFHPKSDTLSPAGVNWAIKWSNLFPACLGGTARSADFQDNLKESAQRVGARKSEHSCGQKKRDKLPSDGFLDPKIYSNSRSFYSYSPNGEIGPSQETISATALTADIINQHISLLNLNCVRLRSSRKTFGTHLEEQFALAIESAPEDIDELLRSWASRNDNGHFDVPFISMLIDKFKITVR